MRFGGERLPIVAKADALADEISSVLKTQPRAVDDNSEHHGQVEERRVKDKGHDDRSETRDSYQIDD